MAIYVDDYLKPMRVRSGRGSFSAVWSHLIADTPEELEAFAQLLGLKKSWLQCEGTWKEHYDVTLATRHRAVEAGAVELTYRELTVRLMARRRSQLEQE